jgi:hypothetical protein
MIKTNTGGPAFLRAGNEWDDMAWVEAPAKDGMTLRDYFAAKAMQALIHDEAADPDCGSLSEWWADVDEKLIGPERFAVAAYMMADAMLRAREAA